MAQLKIAGNVRIGHIYECDFGLYKKPDGTVTDNRDEACTDDYNYRIPNEMIKKRAVVVIGKHRGIYLVVPISSTKETAVRPDKEPESKGFHIKLTEQDFPVTSRYQAGTERWAKSNLIEAVDGGRLRDIRSDQGHLSAHKITDETLRKIREGVMIAIGLRDLIPN
ncbi:MAG TPA: type II toxin-antitoxin system PemK/MazF family toxin [Niabella sp.]|nr:type II toxin-antitoxin system PemK/MazF family toxin [Niabella sp.]